MTKPKEVIFKIDGFTPKTISLARLAEYLREIAKLYGNDGKVHLSKIKKGCVQAISSVDDEKSLESICERVRKSASPSGPANLVELQGKLNTMLADDGVTAEVIVESKSVVIPFPGAQDAESGEEVIGPITQSGSIQGELIRIGGKPPTVPLWLLDDSGATLKNISATKEAAIELGALLYSHVRLHGTGTWERNKKGRWVMKSFQVSSFQTLREDDLHEVVARLRSIEGNGWNEVDDPFGELQKIRD